MLLVTPEVPTTFKAFATPFTTESTGVELVTENGPCPHVRVATQYWAESPVRVIVARMTQLEFDTA